MEIKLNSVKSQLLLMIKILKNLPNVTTPSVPINKIFWFCSTKKSFVHLYLSLKDKLTNLPLLLQ